MAYAVAELEDLREVGDGAAQGVLEDISAAVGVICDLEGLLTLGTFSPSPFLEHLGHPQVPSPVFSWLAMQLPFSE